MGIEEILFSIKESFEATKNHLLSQGEYEAGQILAQKKASLEEWKTKEESFWTEKLQREVKSQRLYVDIMIEQEKKKYFYETAKQLLETTMDEVFDSLRQNEASYIRFLMNCIQKAAGIWQTQEMVILLSERDIQLAQELEKRCSLSLTVVSSRFLSGGVICQYGQEEIDYSFERIREMMRPEMMQWIYTHAEGEDHE